MKPRKTVKLNEDAIKLLEALQREHPWEKDWDDLANRLLIRIIELDYTQIGIHRDRLNGNTKVRDALMKFCESFNERSDTDSP